MHKDLTAVVKNPYTRDKLLKSFTLENLVEISVDTRGGKKYNIKLTDKGVFVAKLLKVVDAAVSTRTDAYEMYTVEKERYIQTKVSEILSMVNANENKEKVAMHMYELAYILVSSPECTLSEDTIDKIEVLITKAQKKYSAKLFRAPSLIQTILYDINGFMESETYEQYSVYFNAFSRYARTAINKYMELWNRIQK